MVPSSIFADIAYILFYLQCSVPCGVGQKTRDVKCVSNIGDVVDDEECNMKLRPNDIENCDMGTCAKSWFLTEWSDRVRYDFTVSYGCGYLFVTVRFCKHSEKHTFDKGTSSQYIHV